LLIDGLEIQDDGSIFEESGESSLEDEEDEEDEDMSHSPAIKSEIRYISEKGATMELYITGITLEVPKGALATEAIVKLSMLDPSSAPEIHTDIGETVLGNIVKVGPAKLKFKKSVILSIPYSIVDIPEHSSICISYFDEGTKKWLRRPAISGHAEVKKCRANIDKPGLYVLCLLLDIKSCVITKSPLEILPFGWQLGVKVAFDENTFPDDQTTVDFKINTFTERMCDDFKLSGIRPIVIFHINVRGDFQPSIPVKISFAIPFETTETLILQSGNGEDFKDVTKQVLLSSSRKRVLLSVMHFSMFAIVFRIMEILNINSMKRFWRKMYEVHVCVYKAKQKGLLFCIGCCGADKRRDMDHEMKIAKFNFVTFTKIDMCHETKLFIQFNGFYTVDTYEDIHLLTFKENKLEFTKSLELHQTTPTECSREIRILVDGAVTPIVLQLKGNGGSGCGSSQEFSSSNANFESKGRFSNNAKSIQGEGNIAAALSFNDEKTISDLQNDYKTVKDLDNKLSCCSFGGIKDLSLRCDLSYKDRCHVLTSKFPCRSFIEDLFCEKSELSLCDVKNDIEILCDIPNKKIFKRIEEDIKNKLVTFSLDSKLYELAENPEIMLYIEDKIADNLIPEEGTLLPTWKDIGSRHGYGTNQFNTFCENCQSTDRKTERLLSLLCARKELLSISILIEKLKHMNRNDVVIVLEEWLRVTMDAGKLADAANMLAGEQKKVNLQEDYILIKELDSLLGIPPFGDIRKLCSEYQLSKEQCNYIMADVLPCHAFFESLSISQPELSLRHLRDTIEKKSVPNNKAIFIEIEEAIESGLISCSLDVQLGVLIDDSKTWLHILTILASHLLPQYPSQLPSWKHIASYHGFSKSIKSFEAKNQVKESPTERFFSVLFSHIPSFFFCEIAKKLEDIGRKDASNCIKDRLTQAMGKE